VKRFTGASSKKKLEPKYNGKIIAIEVDSGKYFIGDDELEAGLKAKAVFPDKIFFSCA
jgi:hypothetical protein